MVNFIIEPNKKLICTEKTCCISDLHNNYDKATCINNIKIGNQGDGVKYIGYELLGTKVEEIRSLEGKRISCSGEKGKLSSTITLKCKAL